MLLLKRDQPLKIQDVPSVSPHQNNDPNSVPIFRSSVSTLQNPRKKIMYPIS